MKMRRLLCLLMTLLLIGCTGLTHASLHGGAYAEETAIVYPLPDATMDDLTDATLSVSFKAGDIYLDDTGKLQMRVRIYTFDAYDLVDVALLKVGDIIMTHAGEVMVVSVAHEAEGAVVVNGGWTAGGLSLMPDDEGGFYYAMGVNDTKDWYELGEAALRVSVDFEGYDLADPELGEVVFYPGSFLVGEVANDDFTPYNTTIRLEAGQVVELHRAYMP